MSFDADALYALQVGVLDAISAQLADTSAGIPGRICVYPGAEIAWDDCECAPGLLAIAATNISPVYREGRGRLPFVNCDPSLWNATLVVVVARCAPESQDDRPPTCEAVQRAAEVQLQDMAGVWRGVQCALAGHMLHLDGQVTQGPMGLCVGSETTFTVGLGVCQFDCPEPSR